MFLFRTMIWYIPRVVLQKNQPFAQNKDNYHRCKREMG